MNTNAQVVLLKVHICQKKKYVFYREEKYILVRHEEVQKGPQLFERVLQWCPCD